MIVFTLVETIGFKNAVREIQQEIVAQKYREP
jgi:hypothetical protein